MKDKTNIPSPNFSTGFLIGLPFIVLGIAQQNIAFFIIGIALSLSLVAAYKNVSSNDKESKK